MQGRQAAAGWRQCSWRPCTASSINPDPPGWWFWPFGPFPVSSCDPISERQSVPFVAILPCVRPTVAHLPQRRSLQPTARTQNSAFHVGPFSVVFCRLWRPWSCLPVPGRFCPFPGSLATVGADSAHWQSVWSIHGQLGPCTVVAHTACFWLLLPSGQLCPLSSVLPGRFLLFAGRFSLPGPCVGQCRGRSPRWSPSAGWQRPSGGPARGKCPRRGDAGGHRSRATADSRLLTGPANGPKQLRLGPAGPWAGPLSGG